MVSVDPFLLILSIVIIILMIFGNIYFLAYYSHHADSFFGSSAVTKIFLVRKFVVMKFSVLGTS